MKLKAVIGLCLIGLIPFISSCGDDDGLSVRDRFTIETENVDAYLQQNNLTAEVDPNSGIRYIVNEVGNGISPYSVDSITYSFTATNLETGEQLQSVNNVKIDWLEVVLGPRLAMRFIQEGGSVQAYIPSVYAYGDGGFENVPPNTTLIYDIELETVHDQQLRIDMEIIADYLSENGLGAQVHPHGFSYVIVEPGAGPLPSLFSTVVVDYEGRVMASGNVFDAGDGAGFVLADLIAGWQVGLPLIEEGGSIILYLPSTYAYGTFGNPPLIPENAPLIFEIDLLTVL